MKKARLLGSTACAIVLASVTIASEPFNPGVDQTPDEALALWYQSNRDDNAAMMSAEGGPGQHHYAGKVVFINGTGRPIADALEDAGISIAGLYDPAADSLAALDIAVVDGSFDPGGAAGESRLMIFNGTWEPTPYALGQRGIRLGDMDHPAARNLMTGAIVPMPALGGGDTLAGSEAFDTLAADILPGSEASDTVYSGEAADSLYGGEVFDTLNGGEAADTLYGGEVFDTLSGGEAADTLSGGEAADTLNGGEAADTDDFVDTTLGASPAAPPLPVDVPSDPFARDPQLGIDTGIQNMPTPPGAAPGPTSPSNIPGPAGPNIKGP